MCKGPRLERKAAASRRRKEPPPSSSPPSPLPVQLAVASPSAGLGAHGAFPRPRSWRRLWGACWAGDPKAPRPVAAGATAQVGALSPQPGGSEGWGWMGEIQARRARSAPWKSCRSGGVPVTILCEVHPFRSKGNRGRVACRGKRDVGLGFPGPSPRTVLRSRPAAVFETALVGPAPLGGSRWQGKESRAWGWDQCGDPHTRPSPEAQLNLGFHPIGDLGGGDWGWDMEHSAGTSPRVCSANNFTSHFRLGNRNAQSPALETSLHFQGPEHGSRCRFSVLTLRPLSGLLLSKNDRTSPTIPLLKCMQGNLRLSEGNRFGVRERWVVPLLHQKRAQ